MNFEDIKFKILDKETKELINLKYLEFEEKELIFVVSEEGKYYETENVIVLPFTGFKDKNGEEIYEGDILKFHCQNPVIFKVGYDGGCFDLRDEDNDINFDLYDLIDDALDYKPLIIGNVWENPELLKESTE